MKTARPSLFHPATLTRLGGHLTIVVTTLALGSVSLDQSGQAAATVSESFRSTLGANNENLGVIPMISDELDDLPAVRPAAIAVANRSFAQVKMNIDPAQDFQNLLPELERIAGQFKSDLPMQAIQIDLMKKESESTGSISDQVLQLLTTAESQGENDRMQLDIQTYAASPTTAAWLDASFEANQLRVEVAARMSPSERERILVTSSAGLWPNSHQSRPAATVLLLLE